MQELATDKEMRSNIHLYKNMKVLKEDKNKVVKKNTNDSNQDMTEENHNLDENDDDDDIDIDELLDGLTLQGDDVVEKSEAQILSIDDAAKVPKVELFDNSSTSFDTSQFNSGNYKFL